MSRFYAGIDLATRGSWICILDENGHKVFDRKVLNEEKAIRSVLSTWLPDLTAVVESTLNWYWIVDLLEDLGVRVKLAHPLYIKAIAYAKVKTDQVDAVTLAQLLRLDYIPEAFIYPRGMRPTRDLIRRRTDLVAQRAGCYTRIRLLLLKRNIILEGREPIKHIDGRHLRGLLPTAHERRSGLSLIHLIDAFDREIGLIDAEIHRTVKRARPIVLLKTVPGVGEVLAPIIYYEIGDISRFPSEKAFSSYCRLVPTIAQSGQVTRRGRNAKQGNRYLKWAFSEAATMAVRHHPPIRDYYQAVLKKKRKRIVAKAILAHKIGVATYHVLKREEPYQLQAAFQ